MKGFNEETLGDPGKIQMSAAFEFMILINTFMHYLIPGQDFQKKVAVALQFHVGTNWRAEQQESTFS